MALNSILSAGGNCWRPARRPVPEGQPARPNRTWSTLVYL